MLGVPPGELERRVDRVGADPQELPHTFFPLVSDNRRVLPMIHTPTTSTIVSYE